MGATEGLEVRNDEMTQSDLNFGRAGSVKPTCLLIVNHWYNLFICCRVGTDNLKRFYLLKQQGGETGDGACLLDLVFQVNMYDV